MEGEEAKKSKTSLEASAASNSPKPESHKPDILTRKDLVDDDDELNELLDSALADFDRPVTSSSVDDASASGEMQSSPTEGGAGAVSADQETMFNDIFASGLADEATKHFEEAMKSLLSEDPNMMQQFEQLSKAAGHIGDGEESQQNFVDALQATVGSMAKNAQGLQEGEISEDDIMKAMSSLGLGPELNTPGEGEPAFIPLMQQMMKSLLSKEVLYPSLKEISEKYPDWLSVNKAKIDASEYDNYNKQFQLMKRICDEFDAETEADTDESKRERFERILDLMQQMQECGQPPAEIVGEMAPGLQFDANGMPTLPDGAAAQCSLM
ncbi:peroxisomal biogenesis factor 19-like [Tubulanus polymorphus]|uniref:peroxisomal biogenesis factor 19-like n=1 Tax=Tubulanus polymorphus TaxID=672921 RepID=UPI003DA3B0F9